MTLFSTVGSIFGFISLIPLSLSQENTEILLFCLWYLNEVPHICQNLIQFGQFWSGQFLIPGLRSGDLPPCGQELTALQRIRSRSTCTCNSMANTLTSTKITSIFTSGIPNTSSREFLSRIYVSTWNAPKSYENNWLQTDFKNETTSKKPIYNGGIFSENASVGIHSLVIFCRGNDISHSSSSSFPDFGPKRASCFHKALQVHEKKLGWKNLCKPIKRMEFPVEYTVCI